MDSFHYDFAMDPIDDGDLKQIEKMQELARRNLIVTREECDDSELRDLFDENPFKQEIMDEKIEEGVGSTIYRQGEWYDLCLGPHVPLAPRC